MKKLISIVFLCFVVSNSWSQDLTVTEINTITNPEHRDNIGVWARGETFTVKGAYTSATANVVRLRLLTFAKGTWVDPLDVENVEIASSAPYSGVINHSITIPNDYLLGVDSGADENTQMLQVSVSFNGFSTVNYNYFLTVVDENTITSSVLDFDAIYPAASGSALVNNINSVLNTAKAGDTILFKSNEYNFDGKSFNIDKGVCLSGIVPAEDDTSIGSYNITSTFKDLKQLNIRSSNVSLCNLKLQAHATTNYVFTRVSHSTYGNDDIVGDHYKNIKMDNVTFDGGKVQVFGGSGAAIVFNQCSFVNFANGGYFLNRKGRLNEAPQFLIQKCFFKPDFAAVNYNVRAISLDAGNDEYPVVWNQNGSTVDNCLLDGTGLGISSKCSYVNVTNSHFLGYRKDVDMIHIEEFGHHFLIDGNTFEHIKPARGLYLDRETQQVHDITITNNKWVGTYAWIISSNAPYNLVFENNDFTQAQASNANDKTFDFTYDHGDESSYLDYELPTKNITFRNNAGLSSKDGVFTYKVLKGDSSNQIEYPTSKIEKKELDEDPISIIDTSQQYRIKNKLGEYLVALEGEDKIGFSSTEQEDDSDVWELEFKYPYYHFVKNVKTEKYIEVYKGYTLGDINNGTSERVYAEQAYTFNQLTALPFWYFRKHTIASEIAYEIIPGGNERKSRLLKVDNYSELEIARENGDPKPRTDASLWTLESTGSMSVEEPEVEESSKPFTLYADAINEQLVVQILKQNVLDVKVSIINTNGKEIYAEDLQVESSLHEIDTSTYNTGVYIVTLTLDGIKEIRKMILY